MPLLFRHSATNCETVEEIDSLPWVSEVFFFFCQLPNNDYPLNENKEKGVQEKQGISRKSLQLCVDNAVAEIKDKG